MGENPMANHISNFFSEVNNDDARRNPGFFIPDDTLFG